MKYGESTFDILYLLIAIVGGCLLLKKARNQNEKRMGMAVLILGCGDAFHLVPRVLHYFVNADFTAALGIGKLITSLTMTVFYVFMYKIWLAYYHEKENKRVAWAVCALAVLRALLCLFPQNGWLQNESGVLWGVIRNVPFVALGALIVALYWKNRDQAKRFSRVWLYVTLSFLFYIPGAVAAGVVPILGMLMLPKTVCYILLIAVFWKAVTRDEAR